MTAGLEVPRAEGQLVWCPVDPALGVGIVTRTEGPRVWVRFLRLQEERAYTTRNADCVILRYSIAAGERVRDQAGNERRVRRRVPEAGVLATYELEDGAEVVESELVPEIRDIGAKERLATLNLVHPEIVRARLQGLDLISVGRRPGHAAILGGRVEWLPHQIDVAARAIEQDPVRMLLADEVGLGKTVEAALIYAGLRQERRAERVLVLVPDALTIQWLGELFRKVHDLFVLLDDDRLDDAAQDFPELTPFEAYHRIVASIDRVATDEVLLEQATAAEWDLVIVDEAHHLRWRPAGGGNPAYHLVERLAARTRHMLLLTATPMALDPAEYHALLRLLDPVRFDDPAAFESVTHRVALIREVARCVDQALSEGRPLGSSVEAAAAEVLGDDPEDKERADDLMRMQPDDPDRPELARVVLDSLQHRHGLADYVVRNRRGPVGGLPERRPQTFALDPTPMQQVLIEVGEAVMFDLASSIEHPKLRNRTVGEMLRALWATPRALAEVLKPLSPELVRELAPHVSKVTDAPLDSRGLPTGDARLRWLVETAHSLTRREKLLVFVESAVAVNALKAALEPVLGGDIAMFHRGLLPRDQDRQVAWFRDPSGPQLMLSTEAGGEGRNFQFCHYVVLYDLPWRPATIEQRIGRVDLVGQRHDVYVMVPHFRSGFEAAILKIMQGAIGVLDRTVGGIDPVLEYVSDQVAELVLGRAGTESWKALYLETEKAVRQARERIEAGVDPILDHASFSPERVEAVLDRAPDDLEARMEWFIERYAEHGKLDVHSKARDLVAVEGAPGAAGRDERDAGYVATFSRTTALDHEDVEFLSFGHPLVEQGLEWASAAEDASAALALSRGFERDGSAFLWRFAIDLPDDVREAGAYFDLQSYTFALDESGQRVPRVESLLLDPERPLDRMDATPLRRALGRWRTLVEESFAAAERMAEGEVGAAREAAQERLRSQMELRQRDMLASHNRALGLAKGRAEKHAAVARHKEQLEVLAREHENLSKALSFARPRVVGVIAVRLMRAKEASA